MPGGWSLDLPSGTFPGLWNGGVEDLTPFIPGSSETLQTAAPGPTAAEKQSWPRKRDFEKWLETPHGVGFRGEGQAGGGGRVARGLAGRQEPEASRRLLASGELNSSERRQNCYLTVHPTTRGEPGTRPDCIFLKPKCPPLPSGPRLLGGAAGSGKARPDSRRSCRIRGPCPDPAARRPRQSAARRLACFVAHHPGGESAVRRGGRAGSRPAE